MRKIVTIVGARPQFIKLAMVSKQLIKKYEEIIVHTGQHYDYNMSEIFFNDLDIPKPDYNLGISGVSHGKMTGEMIIKIEEVLLKENPSMVIVYGDTNSTMAGALAAVKLNIPVCHVEAGVRVGTLTNPEEVNRIVADHISSILLACTESAMVSLKKENLKEKSAIVGDPMYDAYLHYSRIIGNIKQEQLIDLNGNTVIMPKTFYYLTCHRQENTQSDESLNQILGAMEDLDEKCIYPVHPRNQERVQRLLREYKYENILFVRPVGYLMSINLVNHSKKIITDSGGLQREAYFAKKQCVTVFDFVVWTETMIEKRNQLAKPSKEDILLKLSENVSFDTISPFGDGHASEKIVKCIDHYFDRGENEWNSHIRHMKI